MDPENGYWNHPVLLKGIPDTCLKKKHSGKKPGAEIPKKESSFWANYDQTAE